MAKRKFFSLIFFVFFGIHSADVFAVEGSSQCSQLLTLLYKNISAQPVEVTLPNPGKLLVHNREFVEPISKGFSPELLKWSFERLKDEGAFDIPLNEKGVMVAASRSDYAGMVWFRDMWRGFAGKIASADLASAGRLLDAGLYRESDEVQTDRRNISLRNPAAYKHQDHTKVLPHVVLDPKTLGDSKAWSFQKDAYGFFLHSIIDADEAGIFPEPSQKGFAAIADLAMLIRLKFWEMKTTDAWEEAPAIYTSSVGVITGALERFEDLLQRSEGVENPSALVKTYREFSKQPSVPEDVRNIVAESVSRESIRSAIDNGYETIFRQLNGFGEDPEIADPYYNKKGRGADTALLWLFFHRLKRFSEEDYRLVLTKVQSLLRPAGMLRYTEPYADAYLNPAYFFGDNEVVPSEFTRIHQPVKGSYIRHSFGTRYTRYIEDVFGPDFPAQWSLGIIVSVQAYASMVEWFPESPHAQVYKTKAHDYFLRMLAMVTPGPSKRGGDQDLGVALDGLSVEPYKFPEAITRLKIYGADRVARDELSIFSPFSPLYWATAEAIIAFKKMWKLEFPKEPFPGLAISQPVSSPH